MSKRAVCNNFKRPMLDILIVYDKNKYEKTGPKIFKAKTRSTPVKTVPELPGINI